MNLRVGALCLFVTTTLASAQGRADDVSAEVMNKLGQLNYWSKAPTALMLKCSEILPTRRQVIQDEFVKWAKDNATYNASVEKTLKQFRPFAIKTLGMNADQYEVLSTQAADRQITGTYVNNLSTAQMQQLCGQFGKFLADGAMGDMVKPRTTMAVADLQKYLYLTSR